MRNLLFIFLMLFAGYAFAQSTHTIDFETPGVGADWAWSVGENADNPPLEFVANPDNGGINASATAAKFTARATGNPWALCITDDNLEFTFDATNQMVKIMVYKSRISNVAIKFEGLSAPIEIPVANTLINQWEELTFDFSGVIGNTYNRLVIIPDFEGRTEDQIVYFDNIQLPEGSLSNLPEPTTAPADPTHASEDVISIYTEVYDNLPGTNFNPFWGQSTIVTYNYNVAGNNTIKYENLNYQGTEFAVTDVSGYEYLHVDFWTPNATSLSFYLISLGPLEIGYPLEITPETWVSVDIPLDSYVPPVNLGDVFQFKVVGNGVVYFDNWYFWKEPYNPETDATLSDLQVDGTTVDGFSPLTLSYDVELPMGTVDVPEVTATTTVETAEAIVMDAVSLPGTTEVVVTAQDGETQQTYTVNFTVAGETPGSEYCETEVFHFGNPAELASAIYLTITNFDATSMFVEIESATDVPVDLLSIAGGSGAQISDENFSVPGKISRTMTWVDTPPTDVLMNILWSKEEVPGNWQLSQADITVPFEAGCNVGGPAMVKFRVDMSQYVGEFTNAYVSGSFNGWAGETNQLLDPDMDDIYEATLELENGAYEYKFTLDNWAVQEEFTGGEPCVITIDGYHNRALEVSGNVTLPVVCWNSCEACPEIFYDVTLSVDMNNYLNGFGNVYVSGSFNGWSGDGNQMLDPEMDGVYETTLTLAEGSYEYKFTLDGWSAQEQFDGGEPCTILSGGYVNRLLEVTETTTLPTFCWNLCGPCPEPIEVTFNVDMSQFYGSYTNVYVSGEFNNWCGDCNQMLDPDMDMVYEVTLPLNPGDYQYKFTLDNWSQQEEFAGGESCTFTNGAITNRYVESYESEVLPVVCWNSCDICPDYQAGWGGISSNVMPEAKIMLEDLFAPIAEDMVILIGQTGVYWPVQSINTIGEWDTYQGYKVKFAKGVNFEFSGAPLTDRTVTFEPGLYFVPVLSEGPASVSDVIMGHTGIEFMFDMTNNEVYWPEGGIVPGVLGALETLEPGFAYVARFTETTTIDFGSVPGKSNTTSSHFNKMINTTTWNNVSATGSQHIISVNTSQLQSGDFVGTFDINGTCTGLAQYNGTGTVLPLVVFGDDITTTAKDGMIENEAMTFSIYRNGQEMEVTPVYNQSVANHNGLFVENGLSIINEFKMGATSINDQNASSFSIYPNPNNGRFTLVTGGDDMYNFVVVNMQGQQILTSETSGSTTIDLSDQPKGVYFIRLSNTTSTSIEKIVVE